MYDIILCTYVPWAESLLTILKDDVWILRKNNKVTNYGRRFAKTRIAVSMSLRVANHPPPSLPARGTPTRLPQFNAFGRMIRSLTRETQIVVAVAAVAAAVTT